jgi:large subunit ribosomal protein L21
MAKKTQNLSEFAVIQHGGHQYRVAPGQVVSLEKFEGAEVGKKVSFDALLVANGDKVTIGAPLVSGAKVEGEVVEIGRDRKITVIHYRAKSRYFKKAGHRQPFVDVKIAKVA